MSTDLLELERLQSAYADVVSRRAWSELERLFLPDITVEVDTVTSPAKTFTGPAEFIAFVGAACERFDHFQFVILNSVIDVAGDDANGRIFMCEIRHHDELRSQSNRAEEEWSTAYGLYSGPLSQGRRDVVVRGTSLPIAGAHRPAGRDLRAAA